MEIKGYFKSIKRANETVEKLKDAGFNHAYSDMNDHYISDRNTQTNLPGTSTATSLSELVMKSGNTSKEEGMTPIGAANPMVSGMGNFEEIADYNTTVVVDVDSEEFEKAKAIISDMGGTLNNPNLRPPKGIDRIHIDSIADIEDF